MLLERPAVSHTPDHLCPSPPVSMPVLILKGVRQAIMERTGKAHFPAFGCKTCRAQDYLLMVRGGREGGRMRLDQFQN